MMKFLQWVLISLMCSSCTLQPQMIVKDVKMTESDENVQQDNLKEELKDNWIEIEGVLKEFFVQGKDNQYFVYRDLDGKPSSAGPNFMDYRCTLESDNLIIYGHSSRTSDILFTPLMQYLDEEFAKKHHELSLCYEGETRVYELFSVFLFDVAQSSDNDWMQTDFQKEFLFEMALKRLKERSLIDFGAVRKNQLLTLVTCNTENHDERLIVMAVRKQQ